MLMVKYTAEQTLTSNNPPPEIAGDPSFLTQIHHPFVHSAEIRSLAVLFFCTSVYNDKIIAWPCMLKNKPLFNLITKVGNPNQLL